MSSILSLVAGVPPARRAGDVPVSGPVLVEGIEAIDVTPIGAELFGLGHGAFERGRRNLGRPASVFDPPRTRWNYERPVPAARSWRACTTMPSKMPLVV
jgi:hypothetical protein